MSTRKAPYVVLEESSLRAAVADALKAAEIPLEDDEVKRLDALDSQPVYVEVVRLPSRNGEHARKQAAGTHYEQGETPPLVAVTERNFQALKMTVTLTPKVGRA